MRTLLFEDSRVADLYPITLSRPSFNISCGSFRLMDLAIELGFPVDWRVRPHLRQLLVEDFGDRMPWNAGDDELVLVLNGALVPAATTARTLRALLREEREGIVRSYDGRIAAAIVRIDSLPDSSEDLETWLGGLGWECLPFELRLFEYPHDVIREHQAIIDENLQQRIRTGRYQEIAGGVFVAKGAKIGQYVVTDTSRGPIVLEADASIGPYCYITGPTHVGARARVIEHAALKDGVAIGHTAKIGGEVESSTIEPYTNKQHHGFLGHSYLGSWINLGAGTCNSDLKNTYGMVNVRYQGRKLATGMQFVGCVIGDYAKTAINTSIFTGKIVGACSMLYGFVTSNVPSFTNYGRTFGQMNELPVDVMINVQQRMFARRNVPQRSCDIQLLRDMYELTRAERSVTGEPAWM